MATRNDTLIKAFAEALYELRDRTYPRMSQRDLAKLVGVNRTYIAKLELAKNQPTLSVLFELSKILGHTELTLLESTIRRYQRALEKNNKVKKS